ncbi:TPA: MgtC/SapB family protein [Candidatus Micrarchaeota archaeon]|nr:MgtC/SapB family protein [Candidatus Micrarchaeota archaeon]
MVLEFAWKALLALAIGGLVGLEREKKEHHVIGFRTFTLTSFLGMLLTAISGNPFAIAFGLAGVFALAALYYYQKARRLESWGVTTAIMLPTVFVLGVLVGLDFYTEAAIAAIIAVFLLIEKNKVHAITERVTPEEIKDLLLFAIIAFIIFPMLPENPLQFLGQELNLKFFWTIVVLITSLSFAGFVVVKYVGPKAVLLASFFGGLVSSLAVVAVTAGKIKKQYKTLNAIIGAASAGGAIGDVFLLGLLSAALLGMAFPVIAGFFLGYALIAFYYRKSAGKAKKAGDHEKPLSLSFIAELSVALFLVNWLLTWAAKNAPGELIFASLAAGVLSSTGVFASVAYLYNTGGISANNAVFALFAAMGASLAAKIFVSGATTKQWNRYIKLGAMVLLLGLVGLAANLFLIKFS